MPMHDEGYETPKWRTAWLLIGFAVLVGIGVFTVVRPEIEDEPGEALRSEIETSEAQETEEPLQE